jgi:glycosyltransferase involved in cell wall biosynthesis
MKILLDARMYGLEHTGIGRYIINLTEELKKSGTKEQFVILLRNNYFNKLNFPDNWTKVLADFRHYTIAEQIKLPRLISSYKPDIVHFPHFNVPIFYRGNFIVTIHDMIMHNQGKDSTTLSLPLYYAKRILYRFIFKNAVFSSAKIITPTYAVKKQIKEYYKINSQKVQVINEGLNDVFYGRNLKGNEELILRKFGLPHHKFFIYMGNAYPYKNIKRAIEALALLNQRSKVKFQFVVVTSRNVFAKRLKKAIKSQNADNYIKLLGFVEDNELVYLLKNSIAFIYPSLSEGFGLQGLESIAAGTIVLASDIPTFKEVYKNYALYFNPYDFTSIEKCMRVAIGMPKVRREKIVNDGQRFIKRYSWVKMTKQTLQLYKQSLTLQDK